MKRVNPTEMNENDILRAVFGHLRARPAEGVFAFHPKNESVDMRGRRAGIYTALGVEPGIPDVICSKITKSCIKIFALELKIASRRGKPRNAHEEQQHMCRSWMEQLGWVTGVAYGLDDAIAWLEQHGLLSGIVQLKVSGARP